LIENHSFNQNSASKDLIAKNKQIESKLRKAELKIQDRKKYLKKLYDLYEDKEKENTILL